MNNTKSLNNTMRIAAYGLLIGVMLLLATTVGQSVDQVLAKADANQEVRAELCYSACTFGRSLK